MPKVAVITGASSGIGEACAYHFADAGYNLVLVARRKEKLFEICEHAKKTYGVFAQSIPLDLEKTSELQRFVELLNVDYPTIDVVVNAAGLFIETNLDDSSEKLLKDYEKAKTIMLDAPLNLTFQLKDITQKFIYVTSNAGLERNVYSHQGVYAGLKAALNHAIRSFAKDHPGKFYAIAPGNVDTPLLRNAVKDENIKSAILEKYGSEEAFWQKTLTSKDVAIKILEAAEGKILDGVSEMKSSEF